MHPEGNPLSEPWPILVEPYVSVGMYWTSYPSSRISTEDTIIWCPVTQEIGNNSAYGRRDRPSTVSYGYNRFGVGGNTSSHPDYSRLLKNLPSGESETLMFVDSEATGQAGDGWYEAYPTMNELARHYEYTIGNAVFADGHAESFPEPLLKNSASASADVYPWWGGNTN
jgi:prepilin-type processing-associated H-X9-DG protein